MILSQCRVNVTFDSKTIHFWSTLHPAIIDDVAKPKVIKVVDLIKTHAAVSTVAYSPKYRLYLIISTDFKFIFLNEIFNVIDQCDMSDIRLVSHAYFHDEQDLLITGGVNGVFLFKFQYTGNYKPILAAKVDIHGNHIKINLVN